jgi:DNA-binding NtrC family response regulator
MARKIPVLLVDEVSLCEKVGPLLSDSRFDLHCFHDVQQTLTGLNASRFEIAVVDFRLSATDGRSLVEHLIDAIPKIRCVAMVERPDVASVQKAMKVGCKSYLAKPVTPEAVHNAVRDVAQSSGLLSLSEQELQQRLSRQLRAERLRQELTLTELAQRIGLSKAQLSQIELGKSWPSFPTLKRITEELDQPISRIFKEIEQPA